MVGLTRSRAYTMAMRLDAVVWKRAVQIERLDLTVLSANGREVAIVRNGCSPPLLWA